jgi:hypothetical protein
MASDTVRRSRFPIRFDRAYGLLSTALLMRPAASFVEVERDQVQVRMAWSFRTRFPRSAVTALSEYGRRTISRGVHGLAGRWLVNGSGAGIVSIMLQPPQRAYVLGFPVRLRNLLVSVEDPAGLMAALGGQAAPPTDGRP